VSEEYIDFWSDEEDNRVAKKPKAIDPYAKLKNIPKEVL